MVLRITAKAACRVQHKALATCSGNHGADCNAAERVRGCKGDAPADASKVHRLRESSGQVMRPTLLLTIAVGYTADNTTVTAPRFPKEIYYVDRKSAENRNLIEFELASALILLVFAPCVSASAAVSGSTSRLSGYDNGRPGKEIDGVMFTRFNANDEGVTENAADVCGSVRAAVSADLVKNNELPFGGYPGIGTFRMTWRDMALQDAKDRDPWEAVGLVVVVKGRKKYWACRNMAHNLEDMFILNPRITPLQTCR